MCDGDLCVLLSVWWLFLSSFGFVVRVSRVGQMVQTQLYSANGWDSIYGGASAAKSSDGWGDESGADNTGSVSQLHQQDDDVDPDRYSLLHKIHFIFPTPSQYMCLFPQR